MAVVFLVKEPKVLRDKSDEELMLAYQLGDEDAFRELYTRHSGRVLGFLRSKVRNEAKARDIFQATFLKLHTSRRHYNQNFPFIPWLFTVCRSELIDAFRKAARIKEDGMGVLPEGVESKPVFRELDTSVLNKSQQQAIELRYGKDFSFDEIARALGTSPANARQLVSRAVNALRSLYGKK